MNAGTSWGKNTIGPRGRSVEKAPGSDFTFTFFKTAFQAEKWITTAHRSSQKKTLRIS
jgi:hypothetical protein